MSELPPYDAEPPIADVKNVPKPQRKRSARGVAAKKLALVQTGVAGWRNRICAAWQKSVEAIIETGRLLAEAQADPKMEGRWEALVEAELPFGPRTARMLF